MCNSNQEQTNINTDKPVLVQAKYLSTRCPGALNIPHKKLVGQFHSSDAIFFSLRQYADVLGNTVFSLESLFLK